VVYEYPRADGDPYYPVPRSENAALYERYRELTKTLSHVHFVGRLATYRYYNMDQVVAQALKLYAELGQEACNGRSIGHATARGLGGDRVHRQPRG
jgi:UDP-galactopyranose mutase